MEEGIYPYKMIEERLSNRIRESKSISKRNKELIFKFREDCLACNIGLARIIRYLQTLRDMTGWLNKDFDKCKIEDIKSLVAKIEVMDKYCPRTKMEYRGSLKKFYKWLKKNDNPPEVSWIKLNFKKHNEKLPSELVNEQDIMTMLNASKSPRDRAMIISLYESGCRIGEFLKIRLKEIIFEKPGVVFIVNGKTGGRRIRLISSEPYIVDWINNHPQRNDQEAFLWTAQNSKERLGYSACSKVLRVSAIRAGIQKKVNPHNFRHARATYLASRFTEQQLKIFFGWTRGSEMASVYVHLSGKDVDNALLDVYGLKQGDKESKVSKLKPLTCNMCKTENEATNRCCKLCGSILDEKTRNELVARETQNEDVDKVMNLLFKDKDLLEIIAQKIKEVKL